MWARYSGVLLTLTAVSGFQSSRSYLPLSARGSNVDSNGCSDVARFHDSRGAASLSSALLYARGPKGYDDDYFRRKRLGIRRSARTVFALPETFSVQRLLVVINLTFFVLQMLSAANYAPILNSALARSGYEGAQLTGMDLAGRLLAGSPAISISGRPLSRAFGQAITVATSLGPFTYDFVHQTLLSSIQPHRLLTAGFLHGSLLHLVFNLRYLWTMPRWLEKGLGWPLYLSTYLSSIVAGNLAHSYVASSGAGALSLCLGASGGICGLQGLMWVQYRRMGNTKASMSVFRNILWLIVFGSITEGISNAGHIGGFIGGAFVAFLFGPRYGSDYSMRRKWSLAVDSENPEYRSMMGFGIEPKKPRLKLWNLWTDVALAMLARPEIRSIPLYTWLGFRRPGLLSGLQLNP